MPFLASKPSSLFLISLTLLVSSFFFAISFSFITPTAHAAAGDATYVLLEPLPTLTTDQPDLATYLGGVYVLTIGFAGILAVLMIIIGGIEYIFSALPSAKSDAKRRITGAIGGLILAILSWIILNTINPALVSRGFDLTDVGQNAGASANGAAGPIVTDQSYCTVGIPSFQCFDDINNCASATNSTSGAHCETKKGKAAFATSEWTARHALAAGGIEINHDESCGAANVNGVAQGCTNVAGFEKTGMVTKIITFKHACSAAVATSCDIMITGGTEMGHQTHGPTKMAVDLVDTNSFFDGLNAFLGYPDPKSGDTATKSGFKCTYETTGDNGTATGAHWHCNAG